MLTIELIKEFHPITPEKILLLEEYNKLLLKFNENYNLIGKSTISDFWQRHILDCAQIIQFIDCKETIGDIGSGAGLPGIILAILGVKNVHLVEKSFRKCEFLAKMQKLLPNITIHQKRVEEIKNIRFDIITSRAFAPLEKILTMSKPLLAKNGKYVLQKGKNTKIEIEKAKRKFSFDYDLKNSLTSDDGKIILIENVQYI
ncbi:16S rRNA (guanine(527)-N(7))-methyltransferase RsmG [Flavobacteriaceae bacterium]|nr:16S rRNA (guanine(527)-N(7))-methyltransferase RsmG [Flavobacteriaceae bacterium]